MNEEVKFYSTEKKLRSDTKKGKAHMVEVGLEERTESGDTKDGHVEEKISVSRTSLSRKYSQGSVASLRSRSSVKNRSSIKIKDPKVEEKARNKGEKFGSKASIRSTPSESSVKGSRISLKSQTEFDTKMKTADGSKRNVKVNERSGSIVSMGSKGGKKKILTGSRTSMRSKNSLTGSVQRASEGSVASDKEPEYGKPKTELPEVTVELPRNLDASQPSLREEKDEKQDDVTECEENEPEPTAQDVTKEILEDLLSHVLGEMPAVETTFSENQIESEDENSRTSEKDFVDDSGECQENVDTDENLNPKDADTEDDVDDEGKFDESMGEETNQNKILLKCENGAQDKFDEENEGTVKNLENTIDGDILQNEQFAEIDKRIEQENVESRRGIKRSRQFHQPSVPTTFEFPFPWNLLISTTQKIYLHPTTTTTLVFWILATNHETNRLLSILDGPVCTQL